MAPVPAKTESVMEKLSAVQPLFHLIVALTMQYVALSIVTPAIIGVIVEAICPPGQSECGLVVFLSGFQQMSVGVGAMFMTPIIGTLSDHYGRKRLLMVTCAANILPLALLAYRRDAAFVYAYFFLRILIDAGDSGNSCVLLASVGDTIEEKRRGPAFGIILGSLAVGCLMGTTAAKALSVDQVFKVSAPNFPHHMRFLTPVSSKPIYYELYIPGIVAGGSVAQKVLIKPDVSVAICKVAPMLAASAALYLTLFVTETNPRLTSNSPSALEDPLKLNWWGKLLSTKRNVMEAGRFVRNSKVLSKVAVIAFCTGVGEGTMSIALMYYLKSAFDCGKDQFAVFLLITLIAQSLSQVVILPVLLYVIGERKVLCIGLLGYGLQAFLYGVAWAPWVPYMAAFLGVFVVFVFPTTASIVSKTAPPGEQGNLQGFISASKSFANIVTPLVMCPLTALFLSGDRVPFHFPGFSILCGSIPLLFAFALSCFIGPLPIPSVPGGENSSHYVILPSEDMQEDDSTNTSTTK